MNFGKAYRVLEPRNYSSYSCFEKAKAFFEKLLGPDNAFTLEATFFLWTQKKISKPTVGGLNQMSDKVRRSETRDDGQR